MPESPWFMPPGRVLTGAGANAHCFTFVGIPRQLWTFGQVTTWGQVASGPLAHESIAVVNCLMTSAANHGVKVFWETVYSKDIVEWERVSFVDLLCFKALFGRWKRVGRLVTWHVLPFLHF